LQEIFYFARDEEKNIVHEPLSTVAMLIIEALDIFFCGEKT
jgi:hypothetical protein